MILFFIHDEKYRWFFINGKPGSIYSGESALNEIAVIVLDERNN